MVFDLSQVTGLGEYTTKSEKDRKLYYRGQHPFLVLHNNTIELRCDRQLAELLIAQYESVMESRYYGKGGIEIVLAGQLDSHELADLVRLSYNLTS